MSSLSGTGLLVEYQDLFTSSTTTGGMVPGNIAYTGDGREYRFALAGATALVPGKLQQSAAEDTTNWENLAVAAAAIGATTVVTTTTITAAANLFAGGFLMISVTPGQGYQYRIKGNNAAAAAVCTLFLEDPILVALTTSSRIDILPNPYNNVIVNPTTATGAIVGSAVYPVTAAQYGWIQTHGTANILAQGTVVVGTEVAASSTTAGAVVATSGVLASVGYAITGIATTEYGSIFLNIS